MRNSIPVNYDDSLVSLACSVLKRFGAPYGHNTLKDFDVSEYGGAPLLGRIRIARSRSLISCLKKAIKTSLLCFLTVWA